MSFRANLALASSTSAFAPARTHRFSLAPASKPNTSQGGSKPQTSTSSQNAIKNAAISIAFALSRPLLV
ncbi:hypothetical protein FOMPIDRAFT_89716 [Fomitopsis schrenkii]|uniref:Uncharacterized protein n=1 Tax=Fomitopsis schrenkii TaxID=2126942 RepID=S8FPN0_FOMSC|nr:hypothetical protein FOMPIDRAFT_89716 [Fomitopsis schrenkii]